MKATLIDVYYCESAMSQIHGGGRMVKAVFVEKHNLVIALVDKKVIVNMVSKDQLFATPNVPNGENYKAKRLYKIDVPDLLVRESLKCLQAKLDLDQAVAKFWSKKNIK